MLRSHGGVGGGVGKVVMAMVVVVMAAVAVLFRAPGRLVSAEEGRQGFTKALFAYRARWRRTEERKDV